MDRFGSDQTSDSHEISQITKDELGDISTKAQKHQQTDPLKDFIVGVSGDGDPLNPMGWLLFSPKNPPTISQSKWYDPKGEHGYPKFVILDDQSAANVLESGFTKEERRSYWPGNFTAAGIFAKRHRHRGHAARTLTGKLLRTKFKGHESEYVFYGDETFVTPKWEISAFQDFSVVNNTSSPTNYVVTAERAKHHSEQATKQKLAKSRKQIRKLNSSEPVFLAGFKRTVEEFKLLLTRDNDNVQVIQDLSQIVFDDNLSSRLKIQTMIQALQKLGPDTVSRQFRRNVESKVFLDALLPQFLERLSMSDAHAFILESRSPDQFTDLSAIDLRDTEFFDIVDIYRLLGLQQVSRAKRSRDLVEIYNTSQERSLEEDRISRKRSRRALRRDLEKGERGKESSSRKEYASN